MLFRERESSKADHFTLSFYLEIINHSGFKILMIWNVEFMKCSPRA